MNKFIRAAVLALSISALSVGTAYAAGWTLENNTWVYYNNNGTKATNEWKTSADGGYYYLDGWGNMVTSSFIDERYVDADGRMVTSAWRQIDSYWYYFDSNGKMVTDKSKQINGLYYYFDESGRMMTGWIEDDGDWYYCDTTDGHMYTNTWKQLEDSPDMEEVDSSRQTVYDDGTHWFYFRSNGRVARADDSDDFEEYTVNGERYAFDEYGRMAVGWVKLSDTSPIIAGYKYYNDDESLGTYGAAHTGWLSAYPPEWEESLGQDVVWYYFDYRGVPYYGTDVSDSDDDETLEAKFRRITKDGKTYTYLFNELGNPVYGLRKVQKSSGEITSMYFGTQQECCLQYGVTTVTEADGTRSTFRFESSGYGTNGVKNNKLYYMGKLQKALDGSYAYYTVDGVTYLVNRSGSIVKNYNSKKDADEVEFRSDSSGIRDGGYGDVSELEEPVFEITEV